MFSLGEEFMAHSQISRDEFRALNPDRSIVVDGDRGVPNRRGCCGPGVTQVDYEDGSAFGCVVAEVDTATEHAWCWLDGFLAGEMPFPPDHPDVDEIWAREVERYKNEGEGWRYTRSYTGEEKDLVYSPDTRLIPKLESPIVSFQDATIALRRYLGELAEADPDRMVGEFAIDPEILAYRIPGNPDEFERWNRVLVDQLSTDPSALIDVEDYAAPRFCTWMAVHEFLARCSPWTTVSSLKAEFDAIEVRQFYVVTECTMASVWCSEFGSFAGEADCD